MLTDNWFQFTVANAHQVKAIPGRKADELDSQWLARVFSAGLVKPSYILERKIMEPRYLTRLRVSLLESRNIPISWENGKNWTYNKKGNKWLRRMLVQCAMVAIKTRKSQIKQFYLRIRGRRGRRTAIVATARKLLGIIWHLLKTGEEYIDKHYVKKTLKKSRKKNTQTSSGRSNTAT